jgi:N-dimethylarginine dimethylaminohydrolase
MHVVAEGLAAAALPALFSQWSIADPGRIHVHAMHLATTPEQLVEPMTMWARDGAILLQTQEGQEVLLLPRSFRGDGQVDAKLNRRIVHGTGAAPARLQQALPNLIVRRSELSFEGGDVVASQGAVLLGGQSIARSMAELRLPRQAVLEKFAQLLGVRVLGIEPQPEFHVDLGFTFLDETTVAVADPHQAMERVAGQSGLQPLIQATLDKNLGEKYDQAARRLLEKGYQVVRLPNLCGVGLTTPYLTYNNVLLENYVDQGKQVKKVYLPVYDVPALDEAARSLFRQHGYQVIDMPSARLSTKLWGAIRCATGELRVSPCKA